MAYTSIGFAVLDKFADRLWSGSREQCERMIEVNNWRDVMIVETFANRPRTKKRPRAQPKKRVVEAKHESGTILDFKTLDAAARFFELTPDKLYRY